MRSGQDTRAPCAESHGQLSTASLSRTHVDSPRLFALRYCYSGGTLSLTSTAHHQAMPHLWCTQGDDALAHSGILTNSGAQTPNDPSQPHETTRGACAQATRIRLV